jgi:hypothetical protein
VFFVADTTAPGPMVPDELNVYLFPWLRLSFASGAPAEDLFARLDDTRFNLIVVGQPRLSGEPPQLAGLLRTHEIPADPANAHELARASIPNPSFYLPRPDGYIGLAGTRLDAAALRRYLVERLGLEEIRS